MLDATKMQEIVDHGNRHDLEHLVARIKTLDATLKSVAQSKELEEIIIIIIGGSGGIFPPHPPGWTSLAEYAFTLGQVESTIDLVEQVAGMKRALLECGRLVDSESHVAAAK